MTSQITIKPDKKIDGALEVLVNGEFVGLLTKSSQITPGTYELTKAANQ